MIETVISTMAGVIMALTKSMFKAFRLVPETFQDIARSVKKSEDNLFLKTSKDDQRNIESDFMTIGNDMRKVLRKYNERYSG